LKPFPCSAPPPRREGGSGAALRGSGGRRKRKKVPPFQYKCQYSQKKNKNAFVFLKNFKNYFKKNEMAA
jgi:hypothetical protein